MLKELNEYFKRISLKNFINIKVYHTSRTKLKQVKKNII
jgi:hypothetical protein